MPFMYRQLPFFTVNAHTKNTPLSVKMLLNLTVFTDNGFVFFTDDGFLQIMA